MATSEIQMLVSFPLVIIAIVLSVLGDHDSSVEVLLASAVTALWAIYFQREEK